MDKNGPWTILNRELKYKNPWITVNEDKVIRPDGKEGIYGTVEMRGGVSVLAVDDDNNVYLTNEFKYALEKESIEAVSGCVDEGESALESAKRELKEELGVEADEWIDLGAVDPFTSVVRSNARLFIARGLSFGESDNEGTETIKLVKMKFSDAADKVMKSEITHGPSCVLILKAKEFLDF